MELISNERLVEYANGNDDLGRIARELQRYRAAGPLPIELKPGQRWENADGVSYTIGGTAKGLVDVFFVCGLRVTYGDMRSQDLISRIRQGNYRLVAGPGSKP